MKNLGIIVAVLFMSFNCCQKTELSGEIPNCIQQKVDEFAGNASSCETGKTVYRYVFKDQFVFVFNPGNCGADMMSDVYDSKCNLICGLGGIAGNDICLDENFSKQAEDETLIWED
jgi:hypothetical protein